MENQQITIAEGVAFISLFVSASAADSENTIIPGTVAIISALVLLRSAVKREIKNPHTDR